MASRTDAALGQLYLRESGVHCSFSGSVNAIDRDQVTLAHKNGRHDAFLNISLHQALSFSYYEWDELSELKAAAPLQEGWATERPLLGILYPNRTAVVLSDLSEKM